MASVKRQCIIHISSTVEDVEQLVSPKTQESWLTLLEAAKVRNHAPVLELAERQTDEIPEIYYHRKCRSLFTMKRDLETLKRKSSESSKDTAACTSGTTPKRPNRRSTSVESRVYENVCIFCNKIKYQRNSKTREKLNQAVQLQTDQKLRECAIKKGDEHIIAVTSRDIVAAEAHHHASCYRNYTRVKETVKEPNVETEEDLDPDEQYRHIEKAAYESLFEHIRTNIIPDKQIVTVASLTHQIETFMISSGIEHLHDSTKKHIRRKLESELGNSIKIFQDSKGKLLLVPENVSLEDVVLQNQIIQKELRVLKDKSKDVNTLIDQASLHIRSCIRQDMKPTPWPVHPSDIKEYSHIAIPSPLERFLVGLLTGDPNTNVKGQRTSTLTQSFSQDLI